MNPAHSISVNQQEMTMFDVNATHKPHTHISKTPQSNPQGPQPRTQTPSIPYNPYFPFSNTPQMFQNQIHSVPFYSLPQYSNITNPIPTSTTNPYQPFQPTQTQTTTITTIPHFTPTWPPLDFSYQRPSFNNTVYKPLKVDFPRFEGKDPRFWISKCEKYFQLNPTLDATTKVICATLYLEGDAYGTDPWKRRNRIFYGKSSPNWCAIGFLELGMKILLGNLINWCKRVV